MDLGGICVNYFWLNCGYNRFNHFEDLMNQVSVFDSTVHFNPNEGYQAFKRANPGDRVIFYLVQNKIGLLGAEKYLKSKSQDVDKLKFILNMIQSLHLLRKTI